VVTKIDLTAPHEVLLVIDATTGQNGLAQAKYFTEAQVRLIRRTARDRAALAVTRGTSTAVREWALIDVLTSSGLRAAEAANRKGIRIKLAWLGQPYSEPVLGRNLRALLKARAHTI
jgi:site-specific recombinase XerD